MAIDPSSLTSAYSGPATGSFTLEANAHVFKMLTSNV